MELTTLLARENAAPDAGFESFFAKTYPRVAQAAALMIGDSDLGRELAQESFVRAYVRWDRMRSIDHAERFVFKVAFNLARSRLRQNRRLKFVGLEPRGEATRDEDPAEILDARMRVAGSMASLTRRQKTSLILVEYLGFDVPSAARVLGVRPNTVYVHLGEAKRRLKGDPAAGKEQK
jgi:RNA polymerase sigma-70 factor, ECF subfamily